MKKLLLFGLTAITLTTRAQMKEGRVIYERTIQIARLFNSDPNINVQIPKTRTDQFELLFNSNQSLWQYLPNANNDDNGTIQANGAVIRFNTGANEVSYQNFEKGTRVDQREVMDRSFVVSDSIRKLDWKLSDETKTVLNYTVHKATSHRIMQRMQMTMENGEMKRQAVPDTAVVVAWYTTDIPVPAGPDFQGQLPGLTLELDVDNGRTVYKALEVSPKVSVAKIKEPKDGKKVTAQEFAKEREKIMDEMKKNMPAGANIRITN